MNRDQTPAVVARRHASLTAFLPVMIAVAALGAFVGGMRSGERSGTARGATADPPAAAPAPREGARAREPMAARVLARFRAAPAAATAAPTPAEGQVVAPLAATPAQPLVTRDGRPTPALVAKVTAEARSALEAARPGFAERCVPPERRGGATFTFNVTFDAHGREIARGISEDRRLRAPEVASCLRRLPVGALKVPAPGANVGVRVALNLP